MYKLRNLLIMAAAMTLAANALAHGPRGHGPHDHKQSGRSYFDQTHRSDFPRHQPQYRHAPGHNRHQDKHKPAYRKHLPSHNSNRYSDRSRLSLHSLGSGLSVQIYRPSASHSSHSHYHYHGDNRRCYSRH